MQFKQLIPVSLLIFERSEACLHDHIPAPRLRDVQEALRKRDVPASVKTAIQNVRVFDGYNIGNPQTVIIDGEYITDSDDNIAKTIDAGNRILIPGLIDAHAHVQSVEGLENMTSYGVTTIFNMACPTYELCDTLKSNPGLATLFASMLPALAPSGGNAKLNPVPASLRLSPGEDPKFLVDYSFGNGSDYFKIVGAADGPTQDQQNTIVEYTHSLGHFVVQHAPSVATYTRAVSARTDVLQHIPDDGLLPPNIFQSIKDHDLAATPTVEIFRRGYTIQPEIGQFLRGNLSANDSYAHVVTNVKQLHAAGITMLTGTDSVGSLVPIVYFPFGVSLHQEMANFVDFGMTPLEALRAATIVPATVHRLKDRGAIKSGLRADLILLNSNPLENITNTRDIARVWAGGVEYPNVAPKNATG
ncbi:uncharacterized protein GGS22DRAFT_154147 [Annulohypoxylon maeteangense]|uniref:uncharacterized protein n=1 Tax=Annulohypoxylon maeteangense TaxID=1927788 RepID=UPI002007952B|nr:uncharacterized protein GGS22DRAFT_154147 [Annulohypoxylon maeteangense]KAI0887742.1 hypothetical protein GGS22DRAFT_154147 [Annulohypoxylon maeteangense]